jgi:hypothetical protein
MYLYGISEGTCPSIVVQRELVLLKCAEKQLILSRNS